MYMPPEGIMKWNVRNDRYYCVYTRAAVNVHIHLFTWLVASLLGCKVLVTVHVHVGQHIALFLLSDSF